MEDMGKILEELHKVCSDPGKISFHTISEMRDTEAPVSSSMGKVTPLTLGSTIIADSGLPFVTTLRRDTPAFVGLPGATRMSDTCVVAFADACSSLAQRLAVSKLCAGLYAFCSVKSFSDSSLLCTISL